MIHLDVVSAEMMLQFGALCLLTALGYSALLRGGGPWDQLDALRTEIDRRREHG